MTKYHLLWFKIDFKQGINECCVLINLPIRWFQYTHYYLNTHTFVFIGFIAYLKYSSILYFESVVNVFKAHSRDLNIKYRVTFHCITVRCALPIFILQPILQRTDNLIINHKNEKAGTHSRFGSLCGKRNGIIISGWRLIALKRLIATLFNIALVNKHLKKNLTIVKCFGMFCDYQRYCENPSLFFLESWSIRFQLVHICNRRITNHWVQVRGFLFYIGFVSVHLE